MPSLEGWGAGDVGCTKGIWEKMSTGAGGGQRGGGLVGGLARLERALDPRLCSLDETVVQRLRPGHASELCRCLRARLPSLAWGSWIRNLGCGLRGGEGASLAPRPHLGQAAQSLMVPSADGPSASRQHQPVSHLGGSGVCVHTHARVYLCACTPTCMYVCMCVAEAVPRCGL